eukprot:scaffold35110_cov142-Isochrysis_galbana.AAC.2
MRATPVPPCPCPLSVLCHRLRLVFLSGSLGGPTQAPAPERQRQRCNERRARRGEKPTTTPTTATDDALKD